MRAVGVDAYSCDLLPADDASPHHIQGDCLDAMQERDWCGYGMHPDCTYLTVAGIHWNNRGRGWDRTFAALEFVRQLMKLGGGKPWYLENPVSIISTRVRKPDQIIQPYQFGEDASKATCLWLNGLPRLEPQPADQWIPPRWVCPVCKRTSKNEDARRWEDSKGFPRCHHCPGVPKLMARRSNQTDSGQNRLPPSPDRWKQRSKTYAGIAAAMAAQWGPKLCTSK